VANVEKCEPIAVVGGGPRWVRICLACLATLYSLALIHSPDPHSLRPVTHFTEATCPFPSASSGTPGPPAGSPGPSLPMISVLVASYAPKPWLVRAFTGMRRT
jgi:hypothetical protein